MAEHHDTVLVVDDNRQIADVVGCALRVAGYEVRCAIGPDDALADIERHGPPDVLLTDVVMPGKLGTDLADEVVALHPQVAVVFMSGRVPEWAELRGRPLLNKPFALGELTTAIGKAAGREGHAPEMPALAAGD